MSEKSKIEDKEDLLSSTAKGASYLIMLQFISRMLTFSLNQIVLRHTSPDAFGIASVNLELLASTILFISREGFRAVLTRSTKNQQQIINLAYIPTCLGLATTTLCCGYYLSTITSNNESAIYPYYSTSVILYGLASFLELSVEPLFIIALNKIKIKDTSEKSEYWFEKTLLHLGITMTKQSLLKHVLTEGDKMLISVLSTDSDKGVYGFVVNYVDLLAGSTWSKSDAPTVLAVYCMYVPFMGVNGITEGFVQAVATKQDLNRLNYFMVFFSACFIVSGFIFMYWFNLGAVGLILANMVNLSIRVVYSWHYICTYFNRSRNISSWFPHPATMLAFSISWFITNWSDKNIGWYSLKQKLVHVCVGVICFVFVSGIM
ncbi:hypothetical protein RO3G_09999 [Rhizopus delemar RA 99-880]|uniref:Man(5)GlcNAc(2)-PP-dolichol translocation protein RFT1 n=1 Tax=Rhizopus delemar (strain RA 99-880 / ATCC MYA-4621 / FGSC 9543 / NRRL 43880) TaxID=246409 RepID=I1CA09_RHIO9|nr:hypothetical protein RO3G_09999 [Rhizopus delemar RA 99-880]|eukprot:EIE85289.1 hypothetical protein RO3G_09999 [Rhizopus delemar RA 99-880]